jgi:hypothetical protein
MERMGWPTFRELEHLPWRRRNGVDASGNPIAGAPQPNAPVAPPPPRPPQAPRHTLPGEAVIINEVAWAGTLASSSDEWIELLNPGVAPIDPAG